MRIVVAGGSGFLGRPLIKTLRSEGHEVTQLVRRPVAKPEQLTWDPAEPIRLPDGTDAVINLCGAGIGHRWTASYRQQIRDSRVVPTATLARAVAEQRIPVHLNASGVGFYGSAGDRELTEESPHGDANDFLVGVSLEWEGATKPAAEAGSRLVLLRTGLPLRGDGGFLKPQLLPFKLGVGGKLGSGRQWVCWVSYADWLSAVLFALTNDRIEGPMNIAAPNPVTNAQFTKALGRALHRPTIMPVPKLAVKVLYGEYSEEGYRSFRVKPKLLQSLGFTFKHEQVDTALREALSSR